MVLDLSLEVEEAAPPHHSRETQACSCICWDGGLVQIAAGSCGEAAAFLGIATTRSTWRGRIYSGVGHVHSEARKQLNPLSFEASLSGVARELDSTVTPLVNYQLRRQALQSWCIDEDTWNALAGAEVGDRDRSQGHLLSRLTIVGTDGRPVTSVSGRVNSRLLAPFSPGSWH